MVGWDLVAQPVLVARSTARVFGAAVGQLVAGALGQWVAEDGSHPAPSLDRCLLLTAAVGHPSTFVAMSAASNQEASKRGLRGVQPVVARKCSEVTLNDRVKGSARGPLRRRSAGPM